MIHPIKKALSQGLKNVKFKYLRDEQDLIALELRFDWYTFARYFGEKGCSILQNSGYELDGDIGYYYICQNRVDGSIQIRYQGQDEPLYKSKSFTWWQWLTFRLHCICETHIEVHTIFMLSTLVIIPLLSLSGVTK